MNKPLDDPFTVWHPAMSGFCVPTDEINSMSFWCDGLPGVDMRKPNRKSCERSQSGVDFGDNYPGVGDLSSCHGIRRGL